MSFPIRKNLAAKPSLDVGKRKNGAVAIGNDLAIEKNLAGQLSGQLNDFGKAFVNAVHRAREDRNTIGRFMNLRADSIEFVFHQKRSFGDGLGGFAGRFLRRRKHELNRVKELELRGRQRIMPGEHRDFIKIADEQLASLDLRQRLAERLSNRSLKQPLTNPAAKLTKEQLRQIGCRADRNSAQNRSATIARLVSPRLVVASLSNAAAMSRSVSDHARRLCQLRRINRLLCGVRCQ